MAETASQMGDLIQFSFQRNLAPPEALQYLCDLVKERQAQKMAAAAAAAAAASASSDVSQNPSQSPVSPNSPAQ